MPKPKPTTKAHGSHHKRMGGTNTRQTREKGEKRRTEADMKTYGGSTNTNSTSWRESCFEKQLFDFMIVIDFECTCERDVREYPNEIIEFPAVLIDIRNGGKILKAKSFRSYAKPWRNPELTMFCTQLTGIEQRHVENAPDLQSVVKNFEKWYRQTIPAGAKCILATDGPWDFRNFILKNSVKRDHVAFPTIFYEYIDIRTTFSNYFNHGRPCKLEKMLSKMQLTFQGRQHCGFDDAVNIARLAVAMMTKGCIFSFLIALPLDEDKYHYDMEGAVTYRREDSKSGLLTREHVEERAKAVYGDAYYSYGGSTFGKTGKGGADGRPAGGFATALLMALGLRSEVSGVRGESAALDLIDVEAEAAKLAEVSPSTSEDDYSESEDEEDADESSAKKAKARKPTSAEGGSMLLDKSDKMKREVKLAMMKEGALELATELISESDIDRRALELARKDNKATATSTADDNVTPAVAEKAAQLAADRTSLAGENADTEKLAAVTPEIRKLASTELLVECMVELRRRRKESRRTRRNNRVEAIEAMHEKNRETKQKKKDEEELQRVIASNNAALLAKSKTIRIALVSILVFVVIPFFISFIFTPATAPLTSTTA